MLLKAGAAVNGRDKDGGTALMSALESNRNPDVVVALLGRCGCKRSAKDGQSALMTAAMLNPDTIPLLLKDWRGYDREKRIWRNRLRSGVEKRKTEGY